jgi:hypothetical protein
MGRTFGMDGYEKMNTKSWSVNSNGTDHLETDVDSREILKLGLGKCGINVWTGLK